MPLIGSFGAASGRGFGRGESPRLPYSVDFLVIAGGGSGGCYVGGGGGAGGYRNSYNSESSGGGGSAESSITFVPETVYTITIGAGAAGVGPGTSEGNRGQNSLLSGADITTITSERGGGGGAGNAATPPTSGDTITVELSTYVLI